MPEQSEEHRPAEGEEHRPAEGEESPEPAKSRGHRFYYGLGLSLQTLLWFLLFLAITVAVLVGGKLTEFRYVGF
jgi:hypothetical protein